MASVTVKLLLLVACGLTTVWCTEERIAVHKVNWDGDMRECYGTYNGLSISGTAAQRYSSLRRRYSGCNRVLSNLEISFLDDPTIDYDLSFLEDIREVVGYVLIVGNIVPVISLPKLEVIRGFPHFARNNNDPGVYALFVGLNYDKLHPGKGLKQLNLTSLKEMTSASAFIQENRDLCYVDTINWSSIHPLPLLSMDNLALNNNNCPRCHSNCRNSISARSHCWGKGPTECQMFGALPTPPPTKPKEQCSESNNKSQVHRLCRAMAKDLRDTVKMLNKNLKSINRKTRKLQRALRGQRKD